MRFADSFKNIKIKEAKITWIAFRKSATFPEGYEHSSARVSYARTKTGALEITDNNDYYPFGMNHLYQANSHIGIGELENYKYNGKELQETGMYDYGARFYMPDIGRWGVVDPLAEKMPSWSPYSYSFNNPVRFVDPDGREPFDWYLKNGTMQLVYFEGSGNRYGYTHIGSDPTVYSGGDTGRYPAAKLFKDSSFFFNGESYSNGASANVGPYTITSGVQSEGSYWEGVISNLGNNKESFPSMITSGPGRDYDASSRNKLRNGDTTFIIDDFLKPNGGGSGAMTKGFNKFRDVLGNLATSFDNYSEFLTKIGSKPQSQDTIISVPTPIRIEWSNGKPVPIDSIMNFKTPKRHPSWYERTNSNGYDMFNEDVKRQMDSVWNSKN